MSRLWANARVLALAVVAAACGCATRPHALDYVVLQNGDGQPDRPRDGELAKLEAQGQEHHDWPIYGEATGAPAPEPGTGGAGCGVGLMGAECERGLLEDEPPLDDSDLLGEDDQVIEAAIDLQEPPPFTRRRAIAGASGQPSPPPAAPARQ